MSSQENMGYSMASDLLKSVFLALIPTFFASIISIALSFLVPTNQIRVIPALFEDRSIYISIENQGRNLLGPVDLLVTNSSDLKVLGQSNFAVVDIRDDARSKSSMISISQILPQKRTTLFLRASNSLVASSVSLIKPLSGISLISNADLDASILPKSTVISLIIQAIIYLIAFSGMSYLRKRSADLLEETRRTVSDLKKDINAQQSDFDLKMSKSQSDIKRLRSIYVKHRIYLARLYNQIERENNVWRSLLIASIRNIVGEDRRASSKILQRLLVRAGLVRNDALPDLNLEMFLRAVENNDDAALQIADIEMPDPTAKNWDDKR